MKRHLSFLSITASALLFASGNAFAVAIECPSDSEMVMLELNRQASLDPALACAHGTGNPDGSSFFGGGWADAGEVAQENGGGTASDPPLTVEILSGAWGSRSVEALITIAGDFWSEWGSAVISAHIGNGGGDPDWFAWTLPINTTSAIFRYDISGNTDNTGGGLSNIRLWGKDAPDITVPEPSTVGLLGIGLLAVSLVGRRRRQLQ